MPETLCTSLIISLELIVRNGIPGSKCRPSVKASASEDEVAQECAPRTCVPVLFLPLYFLKSFIFLLKVIFDITFISFRSDSIVVR